MLDDEAVGDGHQQATKRRKSLCVTEHTLALLRVEEQFREPRDGGDKLHANTNEGGRAQYQQHLRRC